MAKTDGDTPTTSQNSVNTGALTEREREIYRLLVTTATMQEELAVELGISYQTLKNHITAIYEKCNVASRQELTLRYWEEKYTFQKKSANEWQSMALAWDADRNWS